MLVVAKRVGYWHNMRQYPADSAHPRAGQPFDMDTSKFRTRKDGTPRLPTWVRKLTAAEEERWIAKQAADSVDDDQQDDEDEAPKVKKTKKVGAATKIAKKHKKKAKDRPSHRKNIFEEAGLAQ